MSDIAIKVEGLSKKFEIGHQKSGDIRQAIGDRIRNLFSSKNSSKEIFWALNDINFEIKKGEAVGIIGRNGAGKSTLLKILSRITQPTKGRFEINGRVSSLLEVGTGFHPELSGRENIFLNGTILGMKRAEIKTKFDEIVAFSGVEKFIDTPVKHYSSGMKVRLAFSVAAHLEPEILIIDEVLAVGDAEFQKKCLGKMDDVSKNEGRTVVFVSHNMGAVQRLCQESILIKQGVVDLIDKTDKVIDKYLSVFDEKSIQDWQNTPRNGNGKCKISNVEFINKNSSTIFCSGDHIQIKVRLDFSVEETIKEINLGLAVFDAKGNFMTVFNSKMAGNKFDQKNRPEFLVCDIPKLPLFAGKYYIKPTLQFNFELSDQILQEIPLTVDIGDYYNSGFRNDFGRTGIYINQNWSSI